MSQAFLPHAQVTDEEARALETLRASARKNKVEQMVNHIHELQLRNNEGRDTDSYILRKFTNEQLEDIVEFIDSFRHT